MADRSHLSIGEVLSLLRDEFPDVTISKIRFLESQGLVDPERTPSGYRKFYDQDVEQLRWILRQQREHFLPLKVIRSRLSETTGAGGLEASGPGVASSGQGSPRAQSVPGRGPGAPEQAVPGTPRLVAERGGTERRSAGTEPLGGERSGLGKEDGDERATGQAPPAGTASSHPGPDVASRASGPAGAQATGLPSAPFPPPTRPESAPENRPQPAPASPSDEVVPPKGSSGPPPSHASRQASALPAEASQTPEVTSPLEEEQTYSAEELAAAAGASPSLVTELRQYGLIAASSVVGGTPYFDSWALAVTRAAAGFARHGVEARHLRAWRNSADREAALYEQLIMPLLRQRNPAARRQAAETVAELSRLGGELRQALLERALRDIR